LFSSSMNFAGWYSFSGLIGKQNCGETEHMSYITKHIFNYKWMYKNYKNYNYKLFYKDGWI